MLLQEEEEKSTTNKQKRHLQSAVPSVSRESTFYVGIVIANLARFSIYQGHAIA